MRRYEHVLRMNEERIPQKVFEHESERKTFKRETEIKMGTIGYERHHTERRKAMGKKLRRRSCWKIETDGGVWLSDISGNVLRRRRRR
jgi:hypothetical protein